MVNFDVELKQAYDAQADKFAGKIGVETVTRSQFQYLKLAAKIQAGKYGEDDFLYLMQQIMRLAESDELTPHHICDLISLWQSATS